MKITVGAIAKCLTALTGAIAAAITAGLLAGSTARWAGIGVALLTALATYLVPNDQPPTKPAV